MLLKVYGGEDPHPEFGRKSLKRDKDEGSQLRNRPIYWSVFYLSVFLLVVGNVIAASM